MVEYNNIQKNLSDIYEGSTALDMLIEFEEILDGLHIYSYQNWFDGEVVEGPKISRHWVEVTLMYPYKKMPDPDASLRLIKHGCYVHYSKDTLIVPRDVKTPDDFELDQNGKRKAKKENVKVWLVKISVPRHFIDEFNSEKIKINGTEINMAEVTDAYDEEYDSAYDDEINDEKN